jgi:hypothetical protein
VTNDAVQLRGLARTTGLLYLLIIVAAGFAEGGVRGTLVDAADPLATSQGIAASAGLFRLGLLADLTAFLADGAVAVLLYLLLRPTHRTLALVAAAFRLVAHPAIGSLNLLNHWAALEIALGAGPAAFLAPEEAAQLTSFALELHGHGYVLAGAFFGVHCVLLGILLFRSQHFPTLLGVLLVAAGVGYLVEVLAVFGLPWLIPTAEVLVVATAAVGEVSLCLYLLVRGVRPGPAPSLA